MANREPGGTETVEIAHEALITSWERLRAWVEADLTFRAWQESLRVALRQWRDTSRDKGAVLRGALLADAERWLQRRAKDIGPYERDFIRVSHAHHGRVLRRLRATAASLVVLLLATGVFAIQARQQGSRATAQGRLSLSRLLATQAEAVKERQPDLAILLSLAAYRMHDTLIGASWVSWTVTGQAESSPLAPVGGYSPVRRQRADHGLGCRRPSTRRRDPYASEARRRG